MQPWLKHFSRRYFLKSGATVALGSIVTACGGGGGNSQPGTPNSPPAANSPPSSVIKPIIEVEPTSQNIEAGEKANFKVEATGDNLLYQWFKDGTLIPGAVTDSYTTPATSSEDHQSQYFVQITNNSGDSLNSNSATLSVTNSRITIISQPASQTVIQGQSATFSVSAEGSNLTYQWRKNGVAIAGANNSVYSTPPLAVADDGTEFSAAVTNSTGDVISSIALLNVNSPEPDSMTIDSLAVTIDSTSITADRV